jgi:hypothetical protein
MSKPPITRKGRTHKVVVGEVTAYVTVNRDASGQVMELFAKADAMQGHLDNACRLASLGLQGRATVQTLVHHLRGDRTGPAGGPGQPTSIYDALARVLQAEIEADGQGVTP